VRCLDSGGARKLPAGRSKFDQATHAFYGGPFLECAPPPPPSYSARRLARTASGCRRAATGAAQTTTGVIARNCPVPFGYPVTRPAKTPCEAGFSAAILNHRGPTIQTELSRLQVPKLAEPRQSGLHSHWTATIQVHGVAHRDGGDFQARLIGVQGRLFLGHTFEDGANDVSWLPVTAELPVREYGRRLRWRLRRRIAFLFATIWRHCTSCKGLTLIFRQAVDSPPDRNSPNYFLCRHPGSAAGGRA
jgi:hypothetical protein